MSEIGSNFYNEYQTKEGKRFTIEQPTSEHADELINYSKKIFSSTDQVLTTPEEYSMTVDNEIEWIKILNNNPNSLLLIAKLNSAIIGFLFFISNSKKKASHTGEFGVSVHPDHQGQGVGKRLIETLLQWARKNSQIEKVVLQVFATNKKAIELYKKIGFIEEGRHIKAIKQPDGTYVDIVQMFIETH